ncbi:MAG: helix-turn-helix domain-containing protein [Gammaproteobacteria bacterium]|nr:helix-turn-helix domain-containing protein [Gammaproteobacteria bacterium]
MTSSSHEAVATASTAAPRAQALPALRLYPPSKVRPRKVKTIRALDRGLEVLQVLLTSSACSLRDLHKITRLSKATLTRILMTLAQRGLVWQRIADGAWLPSHTLRANAARFDADGQLQEVAGPILESLVERVKWPSVLAVPRLTWMEVLETNAPRAYFHEVHLGPVGYRAHLLQSAPGRAYLAHCSAAERDAVLQRLRLSGDPADAIAKDTGLVERVLEQTRRQGFGQRELHFGSYYARGGPDADDTYASIAVPINVAERVIGCVNLTWIARTATAGEIASRHLPDLKAAAAQIAVQMHTAA